MYPEMSAIRKHVGCAADRIVPAKTRREKAAMEVIAPAYGAALRSGLPSLIVQLDAALAARDADPDTEPELPRPRPGSILS